MGRNKKRQIDPTEQLGVKALEFALTRFGWVARAQYVGDFGVDVHAETARADGTASGRLIAIQVKSGSSYFAKGNAAELHFYANADHHSYWEGHSLPTLIVFYNPDTEQMLWQWTSEAKRKDKTWRITVPRTQEFNESVKATLAKVADEGKRLTAEEASKLESKLSAEVKSAASVKAPQSDGVAYSAAGTDIRPLLAADVGQGLSQESLAQIAKLLDDKLKPLQPTGVEASAGSSSDPRRAVESEALHAQIDQLRDIKNEGDPAIAHRKLEALLPKIDQAATPFAYFRVVTTLAACSLDLGRSDEAKAGFEEAYRLQPDDVLAVTNLALVRLLEGEHQEAFDLATAAIKKGGYPTHTLTILIGASARLNPDVTPEELVPERDLGTAAADFSIAEFYRVTNNRIWIDKAIEGATSHPDDTSFRRLHAHAVLEAATTDKQFVQGGQSRVSVADVAKVAETLRRDVEAKLAGGLADKEDLANEAANVAIAYRVIGDFRPAIALLENVLAYTGHQPNVIRLLGLLQGLADDEPAAIKTLAAIPEDGEAQLLRAEMVGRDDPAAALDQVRCLPESIIPSHHRTTRWLVAANLALAARDEVALNEALEHIRADAEVAPYADVLDARRQSNAGVPADEIARKLSDVADKLTPDTPFAVRISIAKALQSYDADLKASRVLDGTVELGRDTEATRLYLEVLTAGGRDKDFLSAVEQVPNEMLDDAQVVWLRAVHAFNRGDLNAAEKFARQLRALHPNDLRSLMLLLETLVRRRRDPAIKEILNSRVEDSAVGTLKDRIRLGRLLVGFGFVERGQAFLYRLLLEHRDDPTLWVNFGAAVLNAGRKRDQHLDVTKVGDDVFVRLELGGGGKIEFVVEPDSSLRRLDADAREPTHPDVLAVVGLSTGAAFTLPDGRAGTVGDLRHKFVARMQAVLQEFEQRFPAADGFRSFKIDLEAEGGLDAIKSLVKDRADFVDDQANAYEAGALPLAVFAHNIGVTSIDAAMGLASTGRKFHVAFGNEQERATTTSALQANALRGIVVDAQTFSTIWDLGVADLLEALLGKFHYSANTLYELQRRLEQFGEPDDHDTRDSISYREGRLALQSVPASTVHEAARNLQNAIAWLDSNGVLAPAMIPSELPDDTRELYLQMPAPLLDEIFIAKDRDLLLLVDDLRLRHWAKRFGVERSSWLQWALAYAVDEGLAAMRAYADWNAKLLEAGQFYIGLAPVVFFAAIERDVESGTRKPGPTFDALATSLGGRHADMDSHIRVAAQIIHGLWTRRGLQPLREPATGIILTALLAERHTDYRVILGLLVRVFRRLPLVKEYIAGWTRGHFLEAW
jgi:cellulose synthase operon protein C